MPKDNAQRQREKRAKAKQDRDRLGIVERKWPVSAGINAMLEKLCAEHDFEDWRELVETAIQRLSEAPREEAERFLSVTRHEITITPKVSRELAAFVPADEDEEQ